MKLDKSLIKKSLRLKENSKSKEYCFNDYFILNSAIYLFQDLGKV